VSDNLRLEKYFTAFRIQSACDVLGNAVERILPKFSGDMWHRYGMLIRQEKQTVMGIQHSAPVVGGPQQAPEMQTPARLHSGQNNLFNPFHWKMAYQPPTRKWILAKSQAFIEIYGIKFSI
jgi:hypothetical protein